MSKYSERSQELARELRSKAERNLSAARSARTNRSDAKTDAPQKPKPTVTERPAR